MPNALKRVELEIKLRGEFRKRGLQLCGPFFVPNPGPQEKALKTDAFETLYGGAAGGGKSFLLLGLARTRHLSTLLLRRTYPQLDDSLIHKAREIWAGTGSYSSSRHVWEWPGEKRRVRFGHCERDDDVYSYQGAEFDLIGVDELTQFNRPPYEYLLSRARSTKRGQRVRIVACSNPGGVGAGWVKERWAPWLDKKHPRPAIDGEVRWFKRDTGGKEIEAEPGAPGAMSRTFIAAKLSDNPHLGEGYRAVLDLLPEPYRSQLLDGDWEAGCQDDAWQLIPTAWVEAAMARWTPEPAQEPPDCLGVDVAHGGDDKTVLCARHGSWVGMPQCYPGHSTPDGQSVVALLQPYAGKCEINLDAGGVGASAYDIAVGSGLPAVRGINFGARNQYARDRSGLYGFANIRAEMYWGLREALEPGAEPPLALPPDPELLAELAAPRWKAQIQGIQIEAKDEIRKRLGRSPDKADAVALACYSASVPGIL